MKVANVLLVIALLVLTPVLLLKQRSIQAEKQARAAAEQELEESRAKAAKMSADGEKDGAELARLREQQAELIKLRGEVTSLRRDKEELTKKLAAAMNKPAARPESAQQVQQAAPAAEAQPGMLANEAGRLRRKALSGEQLTEAEMAFLSSVQPKISEIEKSPEAFAEFQSSMVASVLGWTNSDPRVEQIKAALAAASKAANTRGLTFNAPGQTYETWDDAHKALDTRATGAVKKYLSGDEQAVFDAAFPGIMSADPMAAPRK